MQPRRLAGLAGPFRDLVFVDPVVALIALIARLYETGGSECDLRVGDLDIGRGVLERSRSIVENVVLDGGRLGLGHFGDVALGGAVRVRLRATV